MDTVKIPPLRNPFPTLRLQWQASIRTIYSRGAMQQNRRSPSYSSHYSICHRIGDFLLSRHNPRPSFYNLPTRMPRVSTVRAFYITNICHRCANLISYPYPTHPHAICDLKSISAWSAIQFSTIVSSLHFYSYSLFNLFRARTRFLSFSTGVVWC